MKEPNAPTKAIPTPSQLKEQKSFMQEPATPTIDRLQGAGVTDEGNGKFDEFNISSRQITGGVAVVVVVSAFLRFRLREAGELAETTAVRTPGGANGMGLRRQE